MIRKCHKCDQLFGTLSVWRAHKGKRGCKGKKQLSEEGYWQGHGGAWWATEDLHDSQLQVIDFKGGKLAGIGTLIAGAGDAVSRKFGT
jgi:hypothetical protein